MISLSRKKETNGALHGDTVEILLTALPEGKRKEGKIVKIAERGTAKIVGLYQVAKDASITDL